LNCSSKTVRGICYDLDRKPLLHKFQQEKKSCCMLNVENSSNDIVINDNTVIKEKEVAFENKTYEPKVMSMAAILHLF